MKPKEFQRLLFRTAVTTIAVDGEIHESEIEEIKSVVNHTAYFLDFEYEKFLEEITEEIKISGKASINNFLSNLAEIELSEHQKIIIIDVIIRMIEADKGAHQNEIKFLQLVSSKIKISEELLVMKFPKQIEYFMAFGGYSSGDFFDSEVKFN